MLAWPKVIAEAVRNLLARPTASFHLVVGLALVLTVLGLVMVLSASSVEGYSKDGSAYSMFTTQVIFAMLGLAVFYMTVRLPVRLLLHYRAHGKPALPYVVWLLRPARLGLAGDGGLHLVHANSRICSSHWFGFFRFSGATPRRYHFHAMLINNLLCSFRCDWL